MGIQESMLSIQTASALEAFNDSGQVSNICNKQTLETTKMSLSDRGITNRYIHTVQQCTAVKRVSFDVQQPGRTVEQKESQRRILPRGELKDLVRDPCGNRDGSVTTPQLCHCITVLQDVTTGGIWINDTQDLSSFLQLLVNLERPQNKKFNFKNVYIIAKG